MNQQASKLIQAMGVINITPDSFSDGGKFNTENGMRSQIELFNKWSISIYDIGAESTAPFNSPINFDEEMKRFSSYLYPNLKFFPNGATLSIDTYRAETFLALYRFVRTERPDLKLIWNDVSGCLDDALWEVLEQATEVRYVFCHTLTPRRHLSSNHMDYLLPAGEDICKTVQKRFLEVIDAFRERSFDKRLILDPCFGFSKTMDQNLLLIHHLDQVMEPIEKNISLVLGISRKSFIKKSLTLIDEDDLLSRPLSQLEMRQVGMMTRLLGRLPDRKLILRLHHPAVFEAISWSICH